MSKLSSHDLTIDLEELKVILCPQSRERINSAFPPDFLRWPPFEEQISLPGSVAQLF